MIPVLFEAIYPNTHSTFTGHGLGDLIDATEIIAKESSDDGHEWELSFNYPENGELFNDIKNNAIVVAKVNSYQDPQAFRIYSVKRNLNHTINVSCQHISYDLANIPVTPFKVENARTAVSKLSTNKVVSFPYDHFNISTDIPDPIPDPTTDYYVLDFDEPKSSLSVLLDGDDSIVGKYGGDIVINNYSINIKEIGGREQTETIEYGKDLIDFSQEENIGEMITGILPYVYKQTNESLSLSVTVDAFVTTRNTAMVTADKAYTLKAGYKYILSLYTDERPGCTAYINPSCGFLAGLEGRIDMDGTRKDFEIEINSDQTYPANTVIVYSNWLASGNENYGEIYNLKVTSEPIEPLMYGSIAYGPGEYTVQKIKPVDLTHFFSQDPTLAQLNAKAAEWVEKEEVGIPVVDLTLSYAFIDQDIRMYDAVRVKFVKMGVDTTAKVLSYTYDVLNERCTEITVGKAKDSLFFTLEDASRLRKGILPPDRIGKKSITADKYARGSIGSESIGQGAVASYNIEPYGINEELIGEKAVSKRKLKNGGKDPVLQSVPSNVYGGYSRNVGYLFDPSLGVPPDGLFGWTETDQQGQPTGRFHALIETKMDQEYDFNSGSSVVKGMGYVLSPDMIFPASIDASKKVVAKSVTTSILNDLAVTNDKVANDAINWNKTAQEVRAWRDTIAEKTSNFGKVIGPTFMIDTDDNYTTINSINASAYKANGAGAFIQFTAAPAGRQTYGPRTLYLDGVAVGYVLAVNDISLYPNYPDLSAIQTAIRNIGTTLADHESRITALENA